VINMPLTVGKVNSGQTTNSFKIMGTGIVSGSSGSLTAAELASGRITSVEMAVTVISDFGIDQLKRRNFTDAQKKDFLAKNSYQYTKLVQLPSM